MIARIIFSIRQGFLNRQNLKQFAARSVVDVTSISLSNLQKMHIKVLVVDFDGVLAAHGQASPDPDARAWLAKISQDVAVYILSNKPNANRLKFFQENLPQIEFIKAKRKKPYPDGLQQISKLSDTAFENMALVDDRLLTGALAASIVNSKFIYIKPARSNFKLRPIREAGFAVLRLVEGILFG